MKIGLYGGSFDPIHYGHIRPVEEAKQALGLDRVIYLPTARPPHKPGRQFASAHARFVMVELALLDKPDLVVSDFELTPGQPAYSIDTVEHFRGLHPEAGIYLLIGGDSFVDLPTWSRWRELTAAAEIAVLVRPGWELEQVRAKLPPELEALAESERVHFVANRPVAASSTELRRSLMLDEPPPAETVPGLVLEYLRKYALYR